MTITCPQCGFSREADPQHLSPEARVNCPRCGHTFAPGGESELEFIPVESRPAAPPAPADLPKGGFWIRAVAMLMDSLLVSAMQFVFGSALMRAGGFFPDDPLAEVLTSLMGAALAVAYYVFFIGYTGQTPGKMALRLKVIRTDGTPVGYWRAFLREVPGKFLSLILLGIGYLMVAFDRQKQGLHDKIADTYVIKI